jgi:hypothetical protein
MVLLQCISFGGFWNGSTAMYTFWGFLEWFYCNVFVLGVSGMVLLQCISFGGFWMVLLQSISFGGFRNGSTAKD